MKRFDARKKVKEELEKLGLFKEIQNHNLVIPVCSRSKDIIEPMLKPQWCLEIDVFIRTNTCECEFYCPNVKCVSKLNVMFAGT